MEDINTKQVEELTGITRQNIRYYEKVGLIHPERTAGNRYREYSDGDVEQLKMIKMLRMLDMSIEEIARIINEEILIQDALSQQEDILREKERALHAAISMCARMKDASDISGKVDTYLVEMEQIQKRQGGFAQFYNDYKNVIEAERKKQISFRFQERFIMIPSEEKRWKLMRRKMDWKYPFQKSSHLK